MSTNQYVIRNGQSASDGFSLVVTPKLAERRLRSEKTAPRWEYSSLRVLELEPGRAATFPTGEDEMIVLPLAGSCVVECSTDDAAEVFVLEGRRSVFSRVTDFAYVPRDARVTVSSERGGRFALPAARCSRRLSARYGSADGVSVELRGAGQASRQVNNFCMPGTFEADKLIAVEVLTPGGNWSSFPPHKHDEARDGESVLEEVYYFEVDPGGSAPRVPPDTAPGMGYLRVYGSGPGQEVDVCAEVRSGDTVLIPHGWHGPSMAAPGYHLYYLNVMAGPGAERAWGICDDPEHAWVRDSWDDQIIDLRLPLTTTEERA